MIVAMILWLFFVCVVVFAVWLVWLALRKLLG